MLAVLEAGGFRVLPLSMENSHEGLGDETGGHQGRVGAEKATGVVLTDYSGFFFMVLGWIWVGTMGLC